MMVGPNVSTGLIECYIKQTLYDQQPSVVTGSNDMDSRSSMPASSTGGPSSGTSGYYAYLFDETNIEVGSFRDRKSVV